MTPAMHSTVEMALAVGAGTLLGGIFFVGLALTVKHGVRAANPAVWFLASLLLRTAAALGGLYLAAGGDWRRLLAAVAGFVMMRTVLLHRAVYRGAARTLLSRETSP